MNRRDFIRHLGIGICAGAAVPFIPSLIPDLIGGAYADWTTPGEPSALTSRDFQAMLNEYLPPKLLREEFLKRDYVLSNSVYRGAEVVLFGSAK